MLAPGCPPVSVAASESVVSFVRTTRPAVTSISPANANGARKERSPSPFFSIFPENPASSAAFTVIAESGSALAASNVSVDDAAASVPSPTSAPIVSAEPSSSTASVPVESVRPPASEMTAGTEVFCTSAATVVAAAASSSAPPVPGDVIPTTAEASFGTVSPRAAMAAVTA